MAEDLYEYAISTDFSSGVDVKKLVAEIGANGTIQTQLARVEVGIDSAGAADADSCLVVFADALTGSEQTALGVPPQPGAGTVIGDHDGSAPLRQTARVSFYASAASAANAGTATLVPVDKTSPLLGSNVLESPFSLADSEVTVGRAGLYAIVAQATIEVTSAGTGVTSAEAWVEVDGGGGFAEEIATRSRVSVGGVTASEGGSVASATVRELKAGDKLRLRFNRIAGDATLATVANQARLIVAIIRPD